jgi:hypothetical protein
METPDLRWRAKLLLDATESTIVSMDVPAFRYGPGFGGDGVFLAREGEPLGTFYGARVATSCDDLPAGLSCDGFSVNDDGFLVWTGVEGAAGGTAWGTDGPVVGDAPVKWGTPFAGFCVDRVTEEQTQVCPLGDALPNLNLGLASSLEWKGFTFSALLTHTGGVDVYNATLAGVGRPGDLDPDLGLADTQEKPLGYYRAWYEISQGGPSSIWVEDGSYTRLREVSVRYRVPESLWSGVPGLDRLAGANLTLTGRNLFTWTDYRGFDPEIGYAGGTTGSAALGRMDRYTHPTFKSWTAAVEIVF